LRLGRAVLARQEKEEGLDHWRLVPTLNLVAEASRLLGDTAEARRRYAQALAVAERNERVPSPRRAEALAGLALVDLAGGKKAEARRNLQRASQWLRGAVVPDDRRL